MDSVVPLGGRLTPMLWVHGDPTEYERFATEVAEEPTIGEVTELERNGERALYKLAWDGHPDGIMGHLLETDAGVLSASWTPDSWDFAIRFHTPDALSAFHSRCREAGVNLEVTGVRQRHDNEDRGPGLTPQQRETLQRAYENGYYDVPRQVTAVDLADDMGISDQSLSERLRRAHSRLVEHSLL